MKGDVPEEHYEIELFKSHIEKEGTDITIVATMAMVALAKKAVKKLESLGISAEIINPRTLFPLDKETIKVSVAKTGRLVILQEGPKVMGAGAEMGAMIAEELFEYLKAPVKRVTSLDVPVAFAPVLEDYINPSEEHLIKACQSAMNF
ncbi:MAG: transketolase C-terminal domain-containing protein [Spirochaetales bacterium]|nr:transketolase C-terminal domain-containing protein [Spirochaetales bacterium]